MKRVIVRDEEGDWTFKARRLKVGEDGRLVIYTTDDEVMAVFAPGFWKHVFSDLANGEAQSHEA